MGLGEFDPDICSCSLLTVHCNLRTSFVARSEPVPVFIFASWPTLEGALVSRTTPSAYLLASILVDGRNGCWVG
jgi:hypothetical protein